MAFVQTIPVEQASGDVRAMYERAQASYGYVPNWAKLFSHRPPVMSTWAAFLGAIRGNLDPRRYELVALAAARALRSSYCMLAHGAILRQTFYSAEALTAIAGDRASTDLPPSEAAMMAFADKVARDASAITRADVHRFAITGSPTPRSSTSRRPPPPGASSASCWTRSARRPTRRTRPWRMT